MDNIIESHDIVVDGKVFTITYYGKESEGA